MTPKNIFLILIVSFLSTCKIRKLSQEGNYQDSSFVKRHEKRYAKTLSHYNLKASAKAAFNSNLLLAAGYLCIRSMHFRYNEETIGSQGEPKFVTFNHKKDLSIISKSKLETTFQKNNRNRYPEGVFTETLNCHKIGLGYKNTPCKDCNQEKKNVKHSSNSPSNLSSSKNKCSIEDGYKISRFRPSKPRFKKRSKSTNSIKLKDDEIWIKWICTFREDKFPKYINEENRFVCKPQTERNLTYFTGGLVSNIIGFMQSYTFDVTLKYIKDESVWDYSNCTDKSKTKPFYIHIGQGLSKGWGENDFELDIFIDGKITPKLTNIKQKSGTYTLAIEYCPKIEKEHVSLRIRGQERDLLRHDYFTGKQHSIKLKRGQTGLYSLERDKKFLRSMPEWMGGAYKTSYISVKVFNQDIPANERGKEILAQLDSAEIKEQNLSLVEKDIEFDISALQNEINVCLKADVDLLPFVQKTLKENSFVYPDKKVQKLLEKGEQNSSLKLAAGDKNFSLKAQGSNLLRKMRELKKRLPKKDQIIPKSLDLKTKPAQQKAKEMTQKIRDLIKENPAAALLSLGSISLLAIGLTNTDKFDDAFKAYASYIPCQDVQKAKDHFSQSIKYRKEEHTSLSN